jgi:TonB-dependent receptor
MNKNYLLNGIKTFLIILCTSLITQNFAFAQNKGIVTGKLLDASTKEPLFFANISIEGTSIGTSSDEEGEFLLNNVPTGDQTLIISYIGYKSLEVQVSIGPGETKNIGTKDLEMSSIMGEVVEVTAQLAGQASAINQQVKSNQIVNVVSKEKIQEVPDANAAETLSRLPGITISRSGGEGSNVTVRGVSPRFNSITVNGQPIPSTGTNDRSVNLSVVSSDLLDGIELYKAITPDMDGDAIGGTVNLVTKTAEDGFHGRVHLETGYHSLIEEIGTYKGSFSLSNRFLENKLGVIVGANYHRANRNTDYFDGDYELTGDGGYRGNNARFRNVLETRDRYGFSATVDYEFDNGKIIFDHVTSQTTRDVIDRGKRARPTISVIDFTLSSWERTIDLNTTNLRGEFKLFESLDLSFNLGRSSTTNEQPDGSGAMSEMESGLTPESNDAQPLNMFKHLQPYFGLDQFYGRPGAHKSYNKLEDVNYTGQVDFKIPFFLETWFSGDIKFGGKVRQKQRERIVENYQVWDGTAFEYAFREHFPYYADRRSSEGSYPMELFIDEDYSGYDSPFEDHNDIPFVFDPDLVEEIDDEMKQIDSLFKRSTGDFFNQYEATERITAGYLMAEINLGPRITLIPGFRYESTYLDFTGAKGTQRNNEPFRINKTDTSATNTTGLFLPMVHLKYEFINGLALRLAATKTLSRPNFLNLTPFHQKTLSNRIELDYGSIDLKIPTAWNYDAMLSWFSKYGLISVGGFYKEIYDIDINVEYFDYTGTEETNPTYGWQLRGPINSEETTTIYGGEMEVQTNLRFLPKPFDGIVLSGNYAFMESETYYPFFYLDYPPPDYLPVVADSFRVNSTQGQADFIANFTIGYEKKGFSGRISMNYQGSKLMTSGNTEFQDEYEDEYLRWDAALTYKFKNHWQILVNLINITNETERRYIYAADQPSSIQQYGWQANLGLRYKF